jgi:hypothetical protein
MTTDSYELPELPASAYDYYHDYCAGWTASGHQPQDRSIEIALFTADQMRAYALLAVQRERERCIALCQAQIAIYDAKIDEAMKADDINRWDRMDCYKDAVENIAALIRSETNPSP